MPGLPHITTVLAVIAFSSSSIVKSPDNQENTFELLILHNNDMHARFEQTSQLSGTCTVADREAGKCYGGFPRVAHVVKEARRAAASGEGPPVLYLNAGDTYTGSAWFTIYKWKIAAEFLNALEPDAVSLGNSDLITGNSKFARLIEGLETTVLACNIILKSEAAKQKIHKSKILVINGVNVGIVGYLTPTTDILDGASDIEYIDEVKAVQEEVEKLQNQGVKIIIALGNSYKDKDIVIASEVEGIDLVISGHLNIFSSNATKAGPDFNKSVKVVKQKTGKTVPIIQSITYDKYFSQILAVFNSKGDIVSYRTNLLLLDENVPQDLDTLQLVKQFQTDVTFSNVQNGKTVVTLDGESCGLEECNLGNLVLDSIVFYYATKFQEQSWTDAPIAIMNGGAFRGKILPSNNPISTADLLSSIPENDKLVAVNMTGAILNQVLKHSVSEYSQNKPSSQFLQYSGIRATFDFSKGHDSRLVGAVIRCWDCVVPQFFFIDDRRDYKVLMPSSLASGAYGYSMLTDLPRESLAYDVLTCVIDYIERRSPVYPEVADRVVLLNKESAPDSAGVLSATVLVSLGNHEFDHGVSGLTPFINSLTCPVLAANLILTQVPTLATETNLKKSVIFNVSGKFVGVIGYLTPETKMLARKNNVEYVDEIIALKEEVKKLKSQGVHIIIGIGHSGFLKDLQIAKEVDGLSLVIGGHSNTFLWNGTSPDSEKPLGPYPTYVTQMSGKQVPVVQAYAYTKYLGKIHMKFSSEGDLINADGIPILLDKTIPQDPDVLTIVDGYRNKIRNYTEEPIGVTTVLLDGLSCQYRECNMGNLITDAMTYRYASEYRGKHQWTDAPIAIIQGGGIRSSIAHEEIPIAITRGDLITVLPFEGDLVVVSMKGSVLLQMLEHSVQKFNDLDYPGEFLQMSGLKTVYDIRNPSGSRVVHVDVRCWNCSIPTYSVLNINEEYNVIMPQFISNGGDGFTMLEGLPTRVLNYNELICTTQYVIQHSPTFPEIEGRITILSDNNGAYTNILTKSLFLFSSVFIILNFFLI